MAYKIKLGTFKKHENSTAQPVTTSWAEYDITLKDGAELNNPTVTLAIDYGDVVNYNYAYLFNRYYFITSKTMLRTGLCVLDLAVDVLATYKTDIGNTPLYIVRSSANSDGNILDNFYTTTGNITFGHSEDDTYTPAWATYGTGIYVVNVLGADTTGNSTLYALSPTQFRSLIYALYHEIDGFQITDIKDAVNKFLGGSPEKLVSSAMWFPALNFSGTPVSNIVIGTWASQVSGVLITDPIKTLTPITLNIPKHPQAATRGAFLNLAPYSTYTLTLPLFGSVNIDTTLIKNESTLYINISVDALTGQARAIVHAGNNNIIANLTAQMGASVPLQGQSNGASVIGGITSTLAGVAGAIVSGGAAAPVIGAITGGIGAAVSALSGTSCSIGSGGGALTLATPAQLNSVHLAIVPEDNANNGRPLCIVATPESLGGYMVAYKNTVEINGTIPEQEQITNFVENGFYYE